MSLTNEWDPRQEALTRQRYLISLGKTCIHLGLTNGGSKKGDEYRPRNAQKILIHVKGVTIGI